MSKLSSGFLQRTLAKSHPVWLTILASIAAFGTYSCMYAFRKGFTAGTYSGDQLWGVDYKVWLVFAQVLGYMLSKFAGIKIISELRTGQRASRLFLLIGISWIALLGFAVVPAPFNILCLFINGFPLGMIWGIVVSYLEGRRATEFMGTVMAVSLISSSGLAKTVGKILMLSWNVPENWMPFAVGAVFVLPLVLFVFLLEQIPPPNEEDIKLRAVRKPMTKQERKSFVREYLPGIVLVVSVYLLLTIIRDIRDNFEVELWTALGYGKQPTIFTRTDLPIAFSVLIIMSLLILVRNNLKAFTLIHIMVLLGCAIVGISTWLYDIHCISSIAWMSAAGLGLYMAYIPFNCIFFERMIATFRIVGNIGFVMYIADSFGYLGSVGVLFIKQFARLNISWLGFFHAGLMILSFTGFTVVLLSLIYFRTKYNKKNLFEKTVNNVYA
ncbi:DUF5690 family protein [Taibaiella soli]|uniref:MFS transporter n=1 Tax=Taibaiella soli TaxID=1649169 RepID=A0A2W2BCB8_9BACT|nr:DUF5690 family protein [Taibaiella soli]PZF73869.1 hypothetical protein DN068_05875 [Taibaiella soli]